MPIDELPPTPPNAGSHAGSRHDQPEAAQILISTDDLGSPDRSPRNPNLRRMLELVFTVLGAILTVVGIAELGLIPLRLTQYWLASSASVLCILEIADGGEGNWESTEPPTVLSQRGLILRCLTWAGIATTGFICKPALYLATPYTAIFWLFTLLAWKYQVESLPRAGPLYDPILHALATLKRMFGNRRGARKALATGLVAFTAVSATIGTSTAVVAKIKQHLAASAPSSAVSKRGVTSMHLAPGDWDAGSNPSTGSTTATPALAATSGAGNCTVHTFSKVAKWAVTQIDEMLEGGAGLGRTEEGCLESLDTAYASSDDGFVWGEGINPVTGQPLSIILDSYTMHPAIALTPALTAVRQLIRHFGLLGGTEKPFPRYRASGGDYYLLDTANNGTCVLIRSKSGAEFEAPPYTVLYPSAAVAWVQSMGILKHWEWPIESPDRTSGGEVVFHLFSPGSRASDTTITYNVHSEQALWGGYAYSSRQADLSPSELEQDAQEYLH